MFLTEKIDFSRQWSSRVFDQVSRSVKWDESRPKTTQAYETFAETRAFRKTHGRRDKKSYRPWRSDRHATDRDVYEL